MTFMLKYIVYKVIVDRVETETLLCVCTTAVYTVATHLLVCELSPTHLGWPNQTVHIERTANLKESGNF